MKRLVIFLVILLVLLVGLIEFRPEVQSPQEKNAVAPTVATQQKQTEVFRYQGREGVDALTLLQEKTTIEQNDSGLVTTINKRKADEKKREFWSFYVNDKMASVGPKDYITKNSDTIEWKIETY